MTVFSGKSPKYSKVPTLNKVIGQQANQWQGLDLSYVKYCTDDFIVDMPNYYYLRDGDVLLNTLGNGTLGRSGYFDKKLCEGPLLTDGHLFVFRSYSNWLSKFLHIYLQIKYDEIVKSANGSTNQTFLNLSRTTQWLIPVPPLNEVEKIVAEIEKYEPLINEYDKLEQAKSKLDSEIYDKLKKSILQYAIQGKLVPQDENDEPASELLKRIRIEKKAQLGKKYVDSYIYKGDDNCYYEHIDEKAKDKAVEVPFDIPENWTWSRIETIFDLQAGKFISAEKISPIKDDSRPFPCYGGNGLRGYVDCYNHEGAYPLIGRQGALCGNINTVDGKFYATEHAVAVTYHCEMVIGVISAFLQAMNLNQYSTATAQPGLAVSKINKLLFPLPPLDEQKRIVDKINEIFAKL